MIIIIIVVHVVISILLLFNLDCLIFNPIILCLLGNISCVMSFQNHHFRQILSGIPSVSNSLDPDQDRHSVGPDLSANCFQKLSTDYTSR